MGESESRWDEMVTVGRIARSHGNRGEVVVNPETDFLDARFKAGAVVYLLRGDAVQPARLKAVRFQHGRPIIAIEGVETMDAAQALAAAELRVPAADLQLLPEGVYYRHDLVGCRVRTTDGEEIGIVREVEGPLSGSRLVVDGPRGEVLVPLVAEICVSIQPADRLIVVSPPDGLIELNQRPGA